MAEGHRDIGLIDSQGLAGRSEFAMGDAMIQPSVRTIVGPLGPATVEPRVMQVLLALHDANGAVLSREALLEQCWGGVLVGDDAINRTIAELRRVARETGATIPIETIPRIGYRLLPEGDHAGTRRDAPRKGASHLDRRHVIVGGVLATAALAGGAAYLTNRSRKAEVDALIARGRRLQLGESPEFLVGARPSAQAVFRQAVQRDPDRADAWGWLAQSLDDPDKAREAALHALQIDNRDPNARLLIAIQRRDLDDWVDWEKTLLGILADDSTHPETLGHLTLFYQGMGWCNRSREMNERAIAAEPFNPIFQARRALKHWIFGDPGSADKVADQALRLWPGHPSAWNARMVIYAYTDRAKAGLALLEDEELRPANMRQPSIDSWRAALRAIDTHSSKDMANAVQVCSGAAGLAPGLAANAIMTFSYLGLLDESYSVARGLFEGRGAIVQKSRGNGLRDLYSAAGWGRTQFLFIPATAPFRSDARFPALCERLGMVDFWRERGTWPDPFVRGALIAV